MDNVMDKEVVLMMRMTIKMMERIKILIIIAYVMMDFI